MAYPPTRIRTGSSAPNFSHASAVVSGGRSGDLISYQDDRKCSVAIAGNVEGARVSIPRCAYISCPLTVARSREIGQGGGRRAPVRAPAAPDRRATQAGTAVHIGRLRTGTGHELP